MRRHLKNAFIPHEGNNFRPHALRAKTIVPVLVVLVIFQAVAWLSLSSVLPRSGLFGIIEVGALTDGTNIARASDNMPQLQVSPLLEEAAQEKANDMVAKNYFAHTSPSGVTPWYWFVNVGYNFTYAGENLAVNFSDSQDVTNAWLNSPEHRANILDTNYTQIGIATAQGTYNGQPATYVVELFGAPAIASAPVAVNMPNVTAPLSAPAPEPAKNNTPTPKTQTSPQAVATTGGVQIPAVVAVNNPPANTEPNAVAVKGAETSNQSAINSQEASANSNQPSANASQQAAASQATNSVAPQLNPIQKAVANPMRTLDDLYYLIALFFVFALGVNVFVKIRVQHPDLILGGLVAISLAGIFIVVNQNAILRVVIK